MLRVAAACGVDVGALRRARLPALSHPLRPDDRVEADVYVRLWEVLSEAVDDPLFAVKVAQEGGSESDDLLWFACMTASDLRGAVHRFIRYSSIHSSLATWSFTEDGMFAHLTLVRPGSTRLDWRHPDEYAMAAMVLGARSHTNRDFAPREVRFAHASSPGAEALAEVFRAPLRFGCAHSGIVLTQDWLAAPLTKAHPALSGYFETQAEVALRELPNDFPGELARVIMNLLPGGTPGMRDVARKLGLSERTLRRRLEERGTTFQAVLDRTRLDLARRHLAQKSIPLEEVSFLLGFSQAAAFHRAFRRWTGRTPRQYRERPDLPSGSGSGCG